MNTIDPSLFIYFTSFILRPAGEKNRAQRKYKWQNPRFCQKSWLELSFRPGKFNSRIQKALRIAPRGPPAEATLQALRAGRSRAGEDSAPGLEIYKCGPDWTRTNDLFNVNETRYQLRHGPFEAIFYYEMVFSLRSILDRHFTRPARSVYWFSVC